MIDKQCASCKFQNRPLSTNPCNVCNLFAGDPPLDQWQPRATKRDRVGEKRQGSQRKGRPYIRRKEAKQEGEL